MTLPETRPSNINPPQQLRYAILHHSGIPSPHWDLLLETSADNLLATWRLFTPPEHLPDIGVSLQAEPVAPHRRIYLDYQGPLSDNRGHVTRIAQGTWELLFANATHWIVLLHGPCRATLTLPLTEEPKP